MTADERRRRALISGTDHDVHQLSFVDIESAGVEPGPGHTLTLRVALSLGPLPTGHRYVVAFVRGRLDPAAAIVDLTGPSGVTTAVAGIGEPAFSWYLGDFTHGVVPTRPLVLSAVVASDRRPREVALAVRVDVSVQAPRWPLSRHQRLDHARSASPCTFRLVLPADPDVPELPEDSPPGLPATNADVRLCMAADIEAYSRFSNLEAMRAQERFVELLSTARAFAGVDESAVHTDTGGDGQYAVLPAGIDETAVVPGLLAGLERAAQKINNDLNEHARLRIRVALDRGIVTPGVNGWVGRSTITVHRLLDSGPLRAALREHSRRSSAVMISDVLYQDLVRHGYGGLAPEDFVDTVVDLPQKKFMERAWLFRPEPGMTG